MGVFKWLRRDRVSLTSRLTVDQIDESVPESSTGDRVQGLGTIRTDEYKRSLAEFQARRLSQVSTNNAFQTPDNRPRKKSARHSLPVSCTKCSTDIADVSFNYEKTSERNYKISKSRRSSEDTVPNIQFLFSNQQVFMPGNIFTRTSYSEVQRSKKSSLSSVRSQDLTLTRQQIDFDAEDGPESPPLYFKNNCLPFEVSDFLDASPNNDDSIRELKNLKYKMVEKDITDGSDEKQSPARSSCDDKLEEVMDELRDFDEWADEQLKMQSINTTNSEDTNKCDISYYGFPVVSSSAINITEPKTRTWEYGYWGAVPVHVKKLDSVTLDQVKKRQCVEVNILRKFRHPNIMLLMGIYYDVNKTVHLICERCIATLHTILHVQRNILSVQTSVSYASDIASALIFLHMQGYIHTDINSTNIMVTHCGVAKLADLHTCVKYPTNTPVKKSPKHTYESEVQYINVDDGQYSSDRKPLLNQSDTILHSPVVGKAYKEYADSETYRWHPPELFRPDDMGLVYLCSRSDVYALCLVLWECCNAAVPWQTMSYKKLTEQYLMWKTGVRLPTDGYYPGCLLDLMQCCLKLDCEKRIDLITFAERLIQVKSKLNDVEDILIPERLSRKRSEFSSVTWETNSLSDLDSRASPKKRVSSHTALVHRATSESSSKQEDNENSPDKGLYEVYKEKTLGSASGNEADNFRVMYGKLPEREFSSDCSTPVLKKRVTLREIGTPGEALHKSDSTEYCSLFSPENRNFDFTDDAKETSNLNENPNTKLSCSFTPKSYKSLQISVPMVENLEDIKSLKKDQRIGTPTYKFDIKDYSLPTTPIARSNKLRKNAWLSGDIGKKNKDVQLKIVEDSDRKETLSAKSAPEIAVDLAEEEENLGETAPVYDKPAVSTSASPESANLEFETFCDPKRNAPNNYYSFDTSTLERCRSHSWSLRFPPEQAEFSASPRPTEEVLNKVNVKPLVAIHEKWISEANRKSKRLFSSPDCYRRMGPSVKPASHSVDPLQTSMPLSKRHNHFKNNLTMSPTPTYASCKGKQSEQFNNVRDKIARSMSFTSRDPDRNEFNLWMKERSKCMASTKNYSQTTSSIERDEDRLNSVEPRPNTPTNVRSNTPTNVRSNTPVNSRANTSMNGSTNATSLDDFVKKLIKKEFYHLLNQTSDDNCNDEELIQKGTNNVLNALKTENPAYNRDTESIKSFSRVKISGNNKPLIQITFNKSGENSLQVLDSCVNVTIRDNPKVSMDKEISGEEQYSSRSDLRSNALKRCQAFSSIQEAQSTEDLYIDDDLSTHMEENFGGNMKLIPLHGSLHEILCEKADDCCLIKIKQENGCDKMFFMTEDSDSASRDAIDGAPRESIKRRDKVVFKRSISLIEERIERIYPKDKREKSIGRTRSSEFADHKHPTAHKQRPKIDLINKDAKVRTAPNREPKRGSVERRSSDEVVNLEHLMSYQDSSSDESTKSQNNDDVDEFEEMEKRVEEDLTSLNTSATYCGLLEKISEENLSMANDDNGSANGSSTEKLEHDEGIFRAELRKTKSCDELQ